MTQPDIVKLELFTNRFRAIADEMGEMLRRTAISTNVKERLDFSCALLDADGELVVNAPHMPVHLGALGICVRSLMSALEFAPGDVVVTNHPAYGGSHLPDITVVTPVFHNDLLLAFVASRAHHAEIGGMSPGSMPPHAANLAQEGVVIPPFHLIKQAKANWQQLSDILTNAPYPTRALQDNLADLRAAVAANHRGANALRNLANEHGVKTVRHYMEALKALAEKRIRSALADRSDGIFTASEKLDDGAELNVTITIDGERARVDFSGSAQVHPGNLNATDAIVRSVVIYILRLLLRQPLPLNEGLMAPIEVVVPRGMLNPDYNVAPESAPAVVGGNVETSQRLVNMMLRALALAAASQGTMNNTLFGNKDFGYYETVCGGCGAGPGFHGADAVHSHMTNTRITDPEVLEHRYPVRLQRFEIRQHSGGAGEYCGGNGVIRELLFLEEIELSILSQHRREGPAGLAGGASGKPGSQRIERASGEVLPLKASDGCRVRPGDRLILETPGGGGYGEPS